MFGTFFPGPTTIALGFEGRVGYAFNRTVTVFGSATAVAGVGFGADVNENGGSASVSAISYWALGVNADALLAGPLFVGGGVGLGKGGWGVVRANASNNGSGGSEVIAAGGLMPSLDGRIGLITGSFSEFTGKRAGFMIALDLRMLIAPNASTTRQQAGPTGASQSVTTDTTAIGFCPMLHLGFDLR